ncbi:hypothetical protein PCE1_002482 [Barthelona sp. PCE]
MLETPTEKASVTLISPNTMIQGGSDSSPFSFSKLQHSPTKMFSFSPEQKANNQPLREHFVQTSFSIPVEPVVESTKEESRKKYNCSKVRSFKPTNNVSKKRKRNLKPKKQNVSNQEQKNKVIIPFYPTSLIKR